MNRQLNIVTPLHRKTSRDYVSRMVDDKVEAMTKAKEYGYDYWDGDRRYGYGGYRYDGRWKVVAEKLIETYELNDDARILDVGCGKAHLLYELKRLLPGSQCVGFDRSLHGISDAPEDIRSCLFEFRAEDAFPFDDGEFDLVLSLACLHNLKLFQLASALREIQRCGKQKYIMVESYRNEREMFNLQCWALTAETLMDTTAWIWTMQHFGYSGDFEFIFFE